VNDDEPSQFTAVVSMHRTKVRLLAGCATRGTTVTDPDGQWNNPTSLIGHNGGPPLEPITVTFPTGKKISGLGLTTLWKLGKERRIELVRVGRRTLITFRSLKALLTPQAASEPGRRKRGRPRKSSAAERTA
jgi:hypothetical protein